MPRSRKRFWAACGFRAGRALAGDRPPRYGLQGRFRFTVGRGPVPRRASVGTGKRPWAVDDFRADRTIAGDRPPRYGKRPSPFHRRARACPSPCHRVHEHSRGTGPRATVDEASARLTRSGSGDPELRSLGHAGDRGGQAPALRNNLANLANPANPAPNLANRDNLVNPAPHPAPLLLIF